jgi:DNA processing protein
MHDTLTPLYPSLAEDSLVDVLRLIRSENIGCITFFKLIRRCGSAKQALEMLPTLSQQGGRKQALRLYAQSKAEDEIAHAHKLGAQFLVYGSTDYPALLTQIPDAPPLLAAWGQPTLWHTKPIIGMVGARNASAAGCQFTRKIAAELSSQGIIVASGLARGIDTHAHEGSIQHGTVAVIAGGIDNIYPPENENLTQRIREIGCVLAEAPLGTAPQARHFPARNRIIAGMSRAIIITEAAQKSGSLITADYANDYGREVLAVPGSPMDPRSYGANMLIRQGATLIRSCEDVLEALHAPLPALAQTSLFEAQIPLYTREPDEQTMQHARAVIEGKLSFTPVAMDEILEQTGIDANIFFTILLEKELAGVILRHNGGKISLLQYENG